MNEPDIETLNELKIFVNGKFEHLEYRFGSEPKQINEHLRELRNSFDGNGKDGMKTRVSNLEKSKNLFIGGIGILLTGGLLIILDC